MADENSPAKDDQEISGVEGAGPEPLNPSSSQLHTTGTNSRTGGMRWVPPTAEEIQPLFSTYEILALIGQGGMGAVYKARQPTLDRMVAIKILPLELAEDEVEFAARFENEARVLAQMNHPGIVRVFEFGQTSAGQLFMVMEFIEGTDVSHLLLPMQPLPPEHAAGILLQMCDALGYAHGNHVIHRDIKPSNVMLTAEGQVKLMDFGLAKNVTSHSMALTKSHVVMGTPDYIAPEALLYGVQADHRADIFALGVMFYQMLTGVIPRGKYKAPSERVPSLDNRFDIIVRTCMAENPLERYQDVTGLKRSVEKSLHSGPQRQVERPATSMLPQPQSQRVPQSRTGQRTKGTTRAEEKSGVSFIKVAAGIVFLVASYFIWQEVQHQQKPAQGTSSSPAVVVAAPVKPEADLSADTGAPPAPSQGTTSVPTAAAPMAGTSSGTDKPMAVDTKVRLLAPEEGAVMDNGGGYPISESQDWDFTWTTVPGAEGYELRIFMNNVEITTNRFSTAEPHYSFSSRSYLVGSPPPPRKWCVRAIVGGVPQDWSEVRSFQIEPAHTDVMPDYEAAKVAPPVASLPPAKAALVPRHKSPLPNEIVDNGVNGLSSDLREWSFQWEPVERASRYQLMVRREGLPSFFIFGIIATTSYDFTAAGYVSNGDLKGWEWRVRAEVDGKWESWSDASPFTVEPLDTDANLENAPPPPGSNPAFAVMPVFPLEGAILENREALGTSFVSSNVIYQWEPVDGATLYNIYAFQDGARYPAINGTTAATTWSDSMRKSVPSTTAPLQWKVRAKVNGVWQPWSKVNRYLYKRSGEPNPVMPAALAASNPSATVQVPSSNQIREWTDTSGRKINASFGGMNGDQVTLIMGGRSSLVPMALLSAQSQQLARALAGSGAASPSSPGAGNGAPASPTALAAGTMPGGLPPVVCRYTFEGTAPESGAQIKNATQDNGVLVLNGEYEAKQPAGYKAVFAAAAMDYSRFTAAVRLKPERMFDPLLVGGTAYRWLSLRWMSANSLQVLVDQKPLDTVRMRITSDRWITLAVTCDIEAKRLVIYANGRKDGTLKLPEGFQFEVMKTPNAQGNKVWSFTNYSNGTAFKGEVDELVVFGGVLDDKQIAELKLGADAK